MAQYTYKLILVKGEKPYAETFGTAEDAVRLARDHLAPVEARDAAGAYVGAADHTGVWRIPGESGLGRTPVAGVARNTKVLFGVTPGEHERYKTAAAAARISLSEWIRRACAAAMV